MFNQVFQSVSGINNYGLISTIIFVVFFTIIVVYAFSIRKNELAEFSRMPFEDETKDSNEV
ncbi:MAG: cbb3-type cytochrome c oxidase subunit 3 [Bacteroidetes bacterium]|nr:cbb3-type cytochrome c oxidase subunit 3 [Bacteroidota bacterium]